MSYKKEPEKDLKIINIMQLHIVQCVGLGWGGRFSTYSFF